MTAQAECSAVRSGYIEELDGVRGIAALMVIVFHFFQTNPMSSGWLARGLQAGTLLGQSGVTLFFVLSGFLITRILLAAKGPPGFFRNFYARRMLRIFPLYYAYLTLAYLVVPLLTGQPMVPVARQWTYWAYLQNVAMTFGWDATGPAHFWSLAVEEHFYLVWPLLVYCTGAARLRQVTWCLVVLALALRGLLLWQGVDPFFFTLTRMHALLLGALLAIAELKAGGIHRMVRPAMPLVWLLVTAGVVLAALKSYPSTRIVYRALCDPYLATCYCFLLVWVIRLHSTSTLGRALAAGPLAFAGQISYGLYVYHPACLQWVDRVLRGWAAPWRFGGGLLLTFSVAWLSYTLVERRFLAAKRFFGPPAEDPARTPADRRHRPGGIPS